MLDLTNPRDAHKDERLRNEPIIWLSTVRPDGKPHLVPVWFLWDGETFLIFSKPNQQKIRNIRHSPYVMLALNAERQGGDIVTVEGRAELIHGPSAQTTLPAYAEKYTTLMARIGLDPESMAGIYSQAIRITPTRFF